MKLFWLIKLIRPFNCLFSLIAVLFGASYQSQLSFDIKLWAAMSAAFLIAAAGNVINDFFDLEIDIINRPDRILPSGKISPKIAYLFAVGLFVIGSTTSFLIGNFYSVGMAYLNSILLFKYSQKWKKSLLIGNFIVAYSSASTFIFGGLATGNIKNVIGISILAFLISFLREIVKDMEDIRGDSAKLARTFPCLFGLKKSALFSLIPTTLVLAIILFYFTTGIFSMLKVAIFTSIIFLPLLLINIKIFTKTEPKFLHKCSSLIKLIMILVLILYWFL